MQLGFFTQPVHPLGRDYAETLAEDRAIFILADQLGFSEAFCGEHLVDQIENVPSSLLFLLLCLLLHETSSSTLVTTA